MGAKGTSPERFWVIREMSRCATIASTHSYRNQEHGTKRRAFKNQRFGGIFRLPLRTIKDQAVSLVTKQNTPGKRAFPNSSTVSPAKPGTANLLPTRPRDDSLEG